MSTPTPPGPPEDPTPPDAPQHGSTQHGSPPGAAFFDRIRTLGVVRPEEGRWAAGVAAGVARRWGVDPLVVRGLFVAAAVLSGIGLAAYGVAWLLLPQTDGRIHAQEVLRGTVTAGFVGGVVCILVDVPRFGWFGPGWGWDGEPVVPSIGRLVVLGLIAYAIWWAVAGPGKHRLGCTGGSRTSPAGTDPAGAVPAGPGPSGDGRREHVAAEGGTSFPPPGVSGTTNAPAGAWTAPTQPVPVPRTPDPEAPSGALTRATFGLALLVAGSLLLWDRFVHELPGSEDGGAGTLVTAVTLGVVALGIVAAGLLGRRSGGLALVAVVLALVAVTGAAVRGPLGGVGDRTWSPTTVQQAEEGFGLGVGTARLDLSSLDVSAATSPGNPVQVEARVGIGRLVILVPEGTSVEVDASAGLGAVSDETKGDLAGGAGRRTVVRTGSGDPLLVVSAEVGIGNVDVVQPGGQS